ncbi:MAG TPA: S8 family serine peptidase, partial [Paracoccaceae bacterium]|nr:S8 family serine peptidase [Paracoccaceae bacterium]
NNSWGYGLPVTTSSFNSVFSGTNGQAYLSALDAYAAQGVVVFAASNDSSATNATIMEALPALRSTLEAGWLAVISAVPEFNDDRILSASLQSAPCADAARWCLVADGSWTAATVNLSNLNDTDNYAFTIGTSFAAPMVTGAMALLAEAFPDLTPHQLRIRLLASADDGFFTPDQTVELADGFFKGYSSTWGHGFMDLRAALAPIGQTRMALASGATVTTSDPMITSGSGYGDAVSRALAAHRVLVTDDLGGDFRMPGDALVARSAVRAVAPKMMAAALSGAGGASDLLSAYAAPRLNLGLGDGDMRLSVMGNPAAGADAEYGLSVVRGFALGAARLDVGVSLARDHGTLAGLTAAGSDLVSLDLGLTAPLGEDGFLRLSGQMGLAQPRGTGAFADVTSSRFDSLALDIGRTDAFRAGDRLSLSLALPVAMTSGRAALDLPMARSGGDVRFDRVAFDLAPEARQMDLSVSYDMPVWRNATLTLGATHAINHGHVAGARDTGGILALRIRF